MVRNILTVKRSNVKNHTFSFYSLKELEKHTRRHTNLLLKAKGVTKICLLISGLPIIAY